MNLTDIFQFLLFGLVLVCCLLVLTFIARIIGAVYSPRSRQEIRTNPVRHFLWFLTIPLALYLSGVLGGPFRSKIAREREWALERVQLAGGWDAIKRDCLVLANEPNNADGFDWYQYGSASKWTPLPQAIAALNPIRVMWNSNEPVPIVRIHVVGRYNTDNAWPQYWLWFVCREMPKDFWPRVTVEVPRFTPQIRRLTNSVFEVTY
jgi:hypothetical protein